MSQTLPECIDNKIVTADILGYPSSVVSAHGTDLVTTTDEYAAVQQEINTRKMLNYIFPYIERFQAKTIVDVGCGVGQMVNALLERGYDAYGTDLSDLAKYWKTLGNSPTNFFVVDPENFKMPFRDNSLDFAFSLGVIEHVGTTDGHSDRRWDYHAVRRQWLVEVFRIIKPGGHMLIGGPNRQFPIDVAHGPDTRASQFSKWLFEKTRATLHKTWGANFLWTYKDFRNYLKGQPCEMTPQSVHGYVEFSRVPAPVRLLSKVYIKYLPRFMLGSGFNPWAMMLVRKTG